MTAKEWRKLNNTDDKWGTSKDYPIWVDSEEQALAFTGDVWLEFECPKCKQTEAKRKRNVSKWVHLCKKCSLIEARIEMCKKPEVIENMRKGALNRKPLSEENRKVLSEAQKKSWAEQHDGRAKKIRDAWDTKSDEEKLAFKTKAINTMRAAGTYEAFRVKQAASTREANAKKDYKKIFDDAHTQHAKQLCSYYPDWETFTNEELLRAKRFILNHPEDVAYDGNIDKAKKVFSNSFLGKPLYDYNAISQKRCKTLLDKYGTLSLAHHYEYDEQFFDSSDELAMYIYYQDHGSDIKRADLRIPYTYDGKEHFYEPDFVLDGRLTEFKGKQFFAENGTMCNPYDHSQDGLYEAKHQCMLRNDVDIITDAAVFHEYIKKHYSASYLDCYDLSIDFPWPTESEGDFGIIRYYHKSLQWAKRGDLMSPYEAWQNKSFIKNVIVPNRLKYKGEGKITPDAVVAGFSITHKAPKVSVFKPSLAERLIKTYISTDIIFDPFSGFSGRLIGAAKTGKTYLGHDINEDHVRESTQIITYKHLENCYVIVQDILTDIERDLSQASLFTCPPYGGKEHWNKNNDEVEKSCDEWIDICLQKYKCKEYLFVVDKTEKYKDHIVETLTNRSHFGTNTELVLKF